MCQNLEGFSRSISITQIGRTNRQVQAGKVHHELAVSHNAAGGQEEQADASNAMQEMTAGTACAIFFIHLQPIGCMRY